MRAVLFFLCIFFTSLAMPESGKKMEESWKTIIDNNEITHQVEQNSIVVQDKDTIFFIHRAIIKNPKEIRGIKITSIITLNAISCTAKISAIVSDLFYSNDKIVARNVVTEISEIGTPEEGTVHEIMMHELCQIPRKNFI